MMTEALKPSLDENVNNAVRLGKKQIILVRKLGEKDAAKSVLYQTEHEIGMSKDGDATVTKSGTVNMPGAIEYDFSLTCLAAVNDPTVTMLKEAFMTDSLIEVWVINLQHCKADSATPRGASTDMYAADYYHAYVNSYTPTASAEEFVELELEFKVDGVHQEGWATVTADQEGNAQYEFKDTIAIV